MAKIYGEIASSALMTFDKSFSRSNGQPLDSTEVYYSKAAAEAYALTDVAYVGQKLVVIETVDEVTTVAHYGIEADGSLKELGAIPVGDGMTVEVVDGKIQLAALEGHTSGTYQPFLVDGKIEWREPSATTVEGLDSRLTTAEGDIEALEGAVANVYTKEEADGKFALAEDYATQTELDEAIGDLEAKDIEIEGSVTAINTKIGEVTEGKTVVGMIADAQAAATYDDTELSGRVTTNEEAIATLNGDGEGSVNKKVADKVTAEIDAFATKISDDGLVNTFKELVDYVAEHSPEAADMAADIADLQELVGDTSVSAQISAQVADKAKQADLEAAVSRIGANETAIAGKVDAEEGKGLSTNDFTDELLEKVNGIEAGAQVNVIESVDEAQFAIDEQKHLTLLDIAMGKVTGLVDALAGKVDVEDGKRLMTDAEGAKLEGISEGAQVNVIDAIDETQFALGENKTLTLLDIAMGKVTGLQEALDGKADKGTTLAEYGITDAYTKAETLDKIAEKITEINGGESAGEVLGQLNSYKETNDARVAAAEANIAKKVDAEEGKSLISDTLIAKLEAIEEGAQVNKIEAVKVGDTLLEIVDKTVVIPVGAGLKASEEITIAEDGALGVGEINVNKLVQTDGDFLILNGGAAQ